MVEGGEAAVERADPPQPIGVTRPELIPEQRSREHEPEEDPVADEQRLVDRVGDESFTGTVDAGEQIGERLAAIRPMGRLVGT